MAFDDNGIDIEAREVTLFGSVDTPMANRVWLAAKRLTGARPVVFYMNSSGGDVDDGLFMYDTIKSMEAPVTIHVIHQCSSSALMLLQAADFRTAHPNAFLMYHRGTAGYKTGPVDDIEAMAFFDKQQGLRCDSIVYDKMKEVSPRYTRQQFRQFCFKGEYLNVDKAKSLGLLDV